MPAAEADLFQSIDNRAPHRSIYGSSLADGSANGFLFRGLEIFA
jgi:hypothetical protein